MLSCFAAAGDPCVALQGTAANPLLTCFQTEGPRSTQQPRWSLQTEVPRSTQHPRWRVCRLRARDPPSTPDGELSVFLRHSPSLPSHPASLQGLLGHLGSVSFPPTPWPLCSLGQSQWAFCSQAHFPPFSSSRGRNLLKAKL